MSDMGTIFACSFTDSRLLICNNKITLIVVIDIVVTAKCIREIENKGIEMGVLLSKILVVVA